MNLRYHLVSLTAVFLALGLGVIVGSAVVDQGSVTFLEDRLAEVEDSVDETRAENARLQRELGALRERQQLLADQAAPRLLPGLVPDRRVVLVAARGTGEEAVERLRDDLASAGAVVPGTVWLDQRLALDNRDDAEAFIRALGLLPSLVERPDRLRAVAARRVAGALWPAVGPASTEEPPPPAPDGQPAEGEAAPPDGADQRSATAARAAFEALESAGFLEVVPTPGLPADSSSLVASDPEAAVVLVSGEGGELPPDGLLLPLLGAWAAPEGPSTVIAAAPLPDDGQVADDSVIAMVRDSQDLAERVSTVDDIGTFAGRLAAVLVVADGGATGHYGVGEGAERLLPAPPG